MVFLNGKFVPIDEARVSVLDRGFIFGDGVYELVPVYSRVPFRLDEHLARLERSLAEARIRNPHSRAQWRKFIYQLIDAQHYSTAADLYRLAAALISDFPAEYAQYYAQKEFRYNDITQPNRNRLLWLDPTVDGVKTGHTEAAGYCLIASSKRGTRRLLSVLLGSTSETTRAQESLRLLNWGFQFFDSVRLYGAGDAVKSIDVWKGAASAVKVGPEGDLFVTVPKGAAGKLKAELVSQQPLIAPLARGQRVGSLRVTFEGKPYAEYPLVALENVGPAGFFGRAWDTLRLWIK